MTEKLRLCTHGCRVLHYENCHGCLGFGVLTSGAPVTASEAHGDDAPPGPTFPCLACGSTIKGAVLKTYACRTRSGSTYVVARDDDGGFWLTADNVPNPESAKLAGDVAYAVELMSPWPPRAGDRWLWFRPRAAEGRLTLASPKVTSPVESVEEVA